jgi:hypothetical protein
MKNRYRVGLCHRAALLASGGMCAGFGLVALIGLVTHRVALTQVMPGSIPTPATAALGFLLCGVSLLGMGLWFPMVASATSMMVLSLALVLGLERLSGTGPRVEIALAANIGPSPTGIERLALNTILVLLLAAVALRMRFARGRLELGFARIAVVGSIILGLGLSASAGYMTGIPVYCWDAGSPMSFLSAISSFILGLGIVMSAWRYSELDDSGVPRWFPAAVLTGGLTVEAATAAAYALGDRRIWLRPESISLLPMLFVSATACVAAAREIYRKRAASSLWSVRRPSAA